MKVYPTALFKDRLNENFSTCGYTTHIFWKNGIEKYGNIEMVNIENCDIICLFVTHFGSTYIFDREKANIIKSLKKPIIIFDYSEYGQHHVLYLSQYNIFGYKLEHNGLMSGEYKFLNEFLMENQFLIKCYFKRELSIINDLSKIPFRVIPLEFIGDIYCTDENPDTKDKYYARPCLLNFIWGYSNLSRPHLHGTILSNIEKFQAHFALSYLQAKEFLKSPENPFILLVNHDWYERININELMDLQKKSKMIIDLYGCGLKCFRNVESTCNCLSVKQDPTKLMFTYPWIDGENCIILPTAENSNLLDCHESLKILLEYRHDKHHLLYDMYLKSMEMNKLYSPKNYVRNHIIRNIVENI